MCCYKTLQHDENGYVVRCPQCRQLHVAFGTTLLAFTTDQFHEFARMVEEYHAAYKNDLCGDSKIVSIPTVARSVMLVYTFSELSAFHTLLGKARKQMDHEKLFAFCDN